MDPYNLTNGKARPSNENGNGKSPVVWGSVKGQRISMTVQNGKVWLHVYGNAHVHKDQHRLSIGLFPDQALKLIAHTHFLLPIAEEETRAYKAGRETPFRRGNEPNNDEAALTG